MNPKHSLMLTIDHMREAGKNVQCITCNPLSLADLQQMVADTMHCSISHAQTVAALLGQRAEGNPFFARQLLMQMHRDRLITYHASVSPRRLQCDRTRCTRAADGAVDAQQVKGEWRFNSQLYLSLSASQQLTSNVLDLVHQLIQRLSATAQRVLSLAACIGTQFDADTLAVVSELTRAEVTTALREAMMEELVDTGGQLGCAPLRPRRLPSQSKEPATDHHPLRSHHAATAAMQRWTTALPHVADAPHTRRIFLHSSPLLHPHRLLVRPRPHPAGRLPRHTGSGARLALMLQIARLLLAAEEKREREEKELRGSLQQQKQQQQQQQQHQEALQQSS